MDAYDSGLYFLTLWATASGADRATVIANYKANDPFWQDTIAGWGSQTGANFNAFTNAVNSELADGASKDSPTIADINSALLTAGGTTPSVASVAASVVGGDALAVSNAAVDVGSAAITGIEGVLEFLPFILLGVAGIFAYVYRGELNAIVGGHLNKLRAK